MIGKLFTISLTYSFLLPLIAIAVYFKKIRWTSPLIALVSYQIIFFLLNFFIKSIAKLGPWATDVYYFSYTLIEFSIYSFLLAAFTENKKFKLIVFTLGIFFLGFLIWFYTNSSVNRVDSIPIGVESLLTFGYIFYFFYQYFVKVKDTFVYMDPSFWIIVGILLYLGSTFFFNILANYLSSDHINNYWFLTYIGDIFRNILFTISISVFVRKWQENKKETVGNIPNLDMI